MIHNIYNEKRNHQCNSVNTQKKTEVEKEDCFPTLVINIDQYLNKALTPLIHTIT